MSRDLPRMMRAVLMERTGGPEVLTLQDVPVPQPRAGEILVKVHAVTVNRTLDLVVREGAYVRQPALPHVLGVDPAGEIAALGEGVTDLALGQRVVLSSRAGQTPEGRIIMLGVDCWGGYAEYVRLPASCATPIPHGLAFDLACIAARHLPQAFHMLRTKAALQPGEWVLVMGAAGALGSASVQVAKHLGARIIVAAGADARVAAGMALGGTTGVNYRQEDLTARVRDITGGAGVAVVCENIGEPGLFEKAFACLGRGGRLVSVGAHGGGTVPLDISRLYLNQLTVMGSTSITPDDIRDSLKLAAGGGYEALVAARLPLSRAAEAHRLAALHTTLGKVVLNPTLTR